MSEHSSRKGDDSSTNESVKRTNLEQTNNMAHVNSDVAEENQLLAIDSASSEKGHKRPRHLPVVASLDLAARNPGDFDVLFGRGKQHRFHPGNMRMKEIVESYRDAYERSNRSGKTHLSKKIVDHIKSREGEPVQFLKFDKSTDGWAVVSDEHAREKVSHAMRDGKRLKAQPQQPVLGESSVAVEPQSSGTRTVAVGESVVEKSRSQIEDPPDAFQGHLGTRTGTETSCDDYCITKTYPI